MNTVMEASVATKATRSYGITETYNGKTLSLTEWAEETGIAYQTIYSRYQTGKRGEALFAVKSTKLVTTSSRTVPVSTRQGIIVELEGKKIALSEIAKLYKISYKTLYSRYSAGKRGQELVHGSRLGRKGTASPIVQKTVKVASSKRPLRVVTINGVSFTIKEWAEYLGVAEQTFRNRLAKGWKGDKLLQEPNSRFSSNENDHEDSDRNVMTLTVEGVTKTLSEWATLRGISESTIRGRMARGIKGSRLLEKPHGREHSVSPDSAEIVSINGKTLTLLEWSQRTGIKQSTLISRYKNGVRGEELIAPVGSKPNMKKDYAPIDKDGTITAEVQTETTANATHVERVTVQADVMYDEDAVRMILSQRKADWLEMGEHKKALEIAKNLLDSLPIVQVAKKTGLTVKEVAQVAFNYEE